MSAANALLRLGLGFLTIVETALGRAEAGLQELLHECDLEVKALARMRLDRDPRVASTLEMTRMREWPELSDAEIRLEHCAGRTRMFLSTLLVLVVPLQPVPARHRLGAFPLYQLRRTTCRVPLGY